MNPPAKNKFSYHSRSDSNLSHCRTHTYVYVPYTQIHENIQTLVEPFTIILRTRHKTFCDFKSIVTRPNHQSYSDKV